MTKIAILGAAGQIAQLVEPMLLKKTDVDMVLYLRHPNKLHQVDESREEIIKGDASNFNELKAALADKEEALNLSISSFRKELGVLLSMATAAMPCSL